MIAGAGGGSTVGGGPAGFVQVAVEDTMLYDGEVAFLASTSTLTRAVSVATVKVEEIFVPHADHAEVVDALAESSCTVRKRVASALTFVHENASTSFVNVPNVIVGAGGGSTDGGGPTGFVQVAEASVWL